MNLDRYFVLPSKIAKPEPNDFIRKLSSPKSKADPFAARLRKKLIFSVSVSV